MFNSEYGWIYVLVTKGHDIVRIGSSMSIFMIIHDYNLGIPDCDDLTHELYVFNILTDELTCHEINKLIQESSKKYSSPYEKYIGSGGNEFYNFSNIKHIKSFFDLLKIKYEFNKITIADIRNENYTITEKDKSLFFEKDDKVNNTQLNKIQPYLNIVRDNVNVK